MLPYYKKEPVHFSYRGMYVHWVDYTKQKKKEEESRVLKHHKAFVVVFLTRELRWAPPGFRAQILKLESRARATDLRLAHINSNFPVAQYIKRKYLSK